MADPSLMLATVCAMVLGGGFLLWIYQRRLGWRGASKSGARLPKGSFGWPGIGETIGLFRNPPAFASSHVKRYGKIFKSCFTLRPGIVGTTPEFAKLVIGSTNLFEGDWPENLVEILGPKSFIFTSDATRHASIKKLVVKSLHPEALRSQVNVLETMILENMAAWEQRKTIVASEGTQKLMREIGIWLLTGQRDIASTPEGRKALDTFERLYEGVAALPLNLPGTAYNKALKAKPLMTQYLKDLIEKRKFQENATADILGVILAAREDPRAPEEVKNLDNDTLADDLLSMLFAASDAVSSSLDWVFKYLVDNPNVFRRIQIEQQEILKNKDTSVEGPRLSWEDTRKMLYTQKFLQEVHRILSTVPFLARKATQDVEYQGFLIPKGWAVKTLISSIHQDPEIYPNPECFDPDRFNVPPKPYTYVPFSFGPYMCPGMEFSKLLTLIFIHHLATTYTYESAAPDRGTEFVVFPRIIGGYPINFRLRTDCLQTFPGPTLPIL